MTNSVSNIRFPKLLERSINPLLNSRTGLSTAKNPMADVEFAIDMGEENSYSTAAPKGVMLFSVL